jgi:hypothetical protein
VEIVIGVVVVIALIALWAMRLSNRLDRLGARVDAARASLDAQLVRRAAAGQALTDDAPDVLGPERLAVLRNACRAALESDDVGREAAENDLGRLLSELPRGLDPALLHDLIDASNRVMLARRFYNDAVRDTRALRGRRLPRMLRLDRRPPPAFFEIADAVVPAEPGSSPERDGRPAGGETTASATPTDA